MKKIFVLDTNVLLHSALALDAFEDNEIIIPMTVLEELDKFKRNQDELGRNCRKVVRRLDKLRESGSLFDGVSLENGNTPESCGSVRVVVSHGKLDEGIDMSIPDNRIINVAKMLRDSQDKEVILISKDINVRLKADAFRIKAQDFEHEKVKYDELFSGCQEGSFPGELIDELHNNTVIDIPKGLEIQPNEFLLMKDDANPKHSVLTWRHNDRIEKLPATSEHVWTIAPRSAEQRMALQLLTDPEIPLVTLVGKAGSGKTFLALAGALEMTLNQGIYERILISRPIIPMGNDLGFLPGDKEQKLDVWMQPIYDNLDALLAEPGKKDGSAKKKIEELKHAKKLEVEALTYIRGRTIPGQFLIVDEAQNLTPHEVKTIISRCGQGTKIVLTGDPEQIDNPYLDSSSNGLTTAVEHMKQLAISGHITLRKSERSELAAAAAEYL